MIFEPWTWYLLRSRWFGSESDIASRWVYRKSTRKHSSRMRTGRSSGRSGGGDICPGGYLPGDVSQHALGRGVCPSACWDTHPPMDRMTDRCKNITLRNYVAAGKYNLRVVEPEWRAELRVGGWDGFDTCGQIYSRTSRGWCGPRYFTTHFYRYRCLYRSWRQAVWTHH